MVTSEELRKVLTDLVDAWPDEQMNPTVEKARLLLSSLSTDDSEEVESGYHQLTTYDGWRPNRNEMWYSI